MKLSVLIPAYNEKTTIQKIIEQVHAVKISKEIIVVDDGSSDGTRELLKEMQKSADAFPLICIFHAQNKGKGAAIQTALESASGDIIVIQDADLELHPEDYPVAFNLIVDGWADAVFGSRFEGPHRVFTIGHYLANKGLTFLTNVLFNCVLTDMETGFKMIRMDVFKSLNIRSFTFDFEVEVSAKLLKRKHRVYEIPVTYTRRSYKEGKKITWRDGVKAIWSILKYRISNP